MITEDQVSDIRVKFVHFFSDLYDSYLKRLSEKGWNPQSNVKTVKCNRSKFDDMQSCLYRDWAQKDKSGQIYENTMVSVFQLTAAEHKRSVDAIRVYITSLQELSPKRTGLRDLNTSLYLAFITTKYCDNVRNLFLLNGVDVKLSGLDVIKEYIVGIVPEAASQNKRSFVNEFERLLCDVLNTLYRPVFKDYMDATELPVFYQSCSGREKWNAVAEYYKLDQDRSDMLFKVIQENLRFYRNIVSHEDKNKEYCTNYMAGYVYSILSNFYLIFNSVSVFSSLIGEKLAELSSLLKRLDQNKHVSSPVSMVAGCVSKSTGVDKTPKTRNQRVSNIHNSRGNRLYSLGRLEEALEMYGRAVAADSKNAGAHNNRGCCLDDMGRHREAIEAYNIAIELNPDEPKYHTNKGNCLRHLGFPELAQAEYQLFVLARPHDPTGYKCKGDCFADRGLFEEAIEEYNKALALNPHCQYAHSNTAACLYSLERYDEALKEYDLELEYYPKFAYGHEGKGNVLVDMGEYQAAIYEYEEAIRIIKEYAGLSVEVWEEEAILTLEQKIRDVQCRLPQMTDGFPEEKILTCPQCGVEVLADDLFCRKCGTRLKETEL